MIAVDWGTSSFRAFRLQGGAVIDRCETPNGILHVEEGGFAPALRRAIAPWLAAGETRVLMAGMVGSRQGWREAPYLPCPAAPDDLARALVSVPFEGAAVQIVPGLRSEDEGGVPEVMRGEETQLVGVLGTIGRDATVCLPGSHSKWAEIKDGAIAGFSTHMTGEAFAALRFHTILGRMMQDGPTEMEAFRRGVARAGQPGGLLHHLFGVRTQGLFSQLPEAEAASYLSGLLIGHEVAAAAPRDTVHLIGAPALCSLYALAITQHGATAAIAGPDAAAHGLALIAERAAWT